MPPAALALAGVPEFEALPLATRRRVSQLEYVHLLHAGLWLESLFIARVAGLVHRCSDAATRMRLLEEMREEAGHSLMFVELLRRSGFAPAAAHGRALRLVDVLARTLPSGSALFWALVVAGEELPDRLNRQIQRGVEDVTVSAVVYRMSRIHAEDEAAHAAYARERCVEAAARCPRWVRAALAPAVGAAIGLYARYVYFPPAELYVQAGLAPGRLWRARALANPRRAALVAGMLRPTVAFLRRSGWPVITPARQG